MHSYHSSADLEPLSRSDPDLWREIYGYMQVCLYEDDEVDLSISGKFGVEKKHF